MGRFLHIVLGAALLTPALTTAGTAAAEEFPSGWYIVFGAGASAPTDNDIDGQDAGTNTGGSDSIEDCDLGAAAFGRPFGMFEDHRLHFVGRDGDTTQVRVARTYIEVGVGESAIYELAGMAIAHDGEVVCVTDGVALGYENTHHNWMDTATATHGAFRYQLTLSFVVGPDDPEEVFEITAMDAPDRIAWGPVRLDLANP